MPNSRDTHRQPLKPSTVSSTSAESASAAGERSGLQRSRMIAATVAALAEHGYKGTSVARIVAYAGVSRTTFDEHFDDRDDCVLCALEQSLRENGGLVAQTHLRKDKWSEHLTAALRSLLEFLDDRCGTQALESARRRGAEATVLKHRARVLEILSSVTREGRT
jgi:AcrR family transcriptional regulator